MKREHYIIEVSIKRVYREPTGVQKYNAETKQNEPEYGDRRHSEIVKLIKQAPTLNKAIQLTSKHLAVELEEALPGE